MADFIAKGRPVPLLEGGENWYSWKSVLKAVLQTQDLYGLVDGTAKKPEPYKKSGSSSGDGDAKEDDKGGKKKGKEKEEGDSTKEEEAKLKAEADAKIA